MTSRRAFFAQLAGAAAIALDPERALWVPGAKMISIPRRKIGETITIKRPMRIAFHRDAFAMVVPPLPFELLPPVKVVSLEWSPEDFRVDFERGFGSNA
jgi:hypothetical protein